MVDQGLSFATFGALISLNGLVVVLLELPLTAITGRHARRPVIAVGFLLTGVGFALTAWATDVPLLALTVVIWTVGEIAAMPVAQTYVADLAPPHLGGRYQGAWGLTFGLALVLAPIVGTAAYAANPTVLWLSCGPWALSSLLVLGVTPRRRRLAAGHARADLLEAVVALGVADAGDEQEDEGHARRQQPGDDERRLDAEPGRDGAGEGEGDRDEARRDEPVEARHAPEDLGRDERLHQRSPRPCRR